MQMNGGYENEAEFSLGDYQQSFDVMRSDEIRKYPEHLTRKFNDNTEQEYIRQDWEIGYAVKIL